MAKNIRKFTPKFLSNFMIIHIFSRKCFETHNELDFRSDKTCIESVVEMEQFRLICTVIQTKYVTKE